MLDYTVLSGKQVVPDTPLGTLDTHATTCQCLSDKPGWIVGVYARPAASSFPEMVVGSMRVSRDYGS